MTSHDGQPTGVDVAGLLFDNDGVLIDSAATVEATWRTFASWYDLPEGEVLALVHGRRSRDVITRFAHRLPVPVDAAYERYIRHCLEDPDVAPLPGAVELLGTLLTDRWAVVTSGTAVVTRARIAAAGLPEPPVLITAEDVPAGKPDPAPYLVAAERLGLDPHDCLAVEDAPAGLTSARMAGCHTIAVLTTHDAAALDGDQVAKDLTGVHVTMVGDRLHVAVEPAL